MLLETRRKPFAYAIAAVIAAALVLFGLAVPLPAQAATVESDGVTLDVSYGDATYGDHTVVEPGTTYQATIQYDLATIEPGDTVTLTVPDGVTFPDGVPAGNGAISEITQDGNRLTLAFDGDFSNNQGGIVLRFQVEEPADGSGLEDMTWKLDDEETSQTVIVKKPGDEFRPEITDGLSKSVGAHDLNGAVSYDEDTLEVVLADDVTEIEVPYTLTVGSADARTATISDTISEYLAYDQGSFSASIVSWDENGLNKTSSDVDLPAGQPTFDGQSFAIEGLDLPAQSIVEIRYAAHVKDDGVDALTAALQEEFDAIDPAAGGDYTVALENEAALDGGGAVNGSTTIGSNRAKDPQPDRGSAYTKSVDVTGDQIIRHDEDGTLTAPIDVVYTLTADLTEYADFASTPYGLKSNVVIKDAPDHQRAIDLDEGGITATVNGEATTLSAADGNPSEEEFSGDEYVGRYSWAKSGDTQELWVNIGQDVTEKWSIVVPGQIVSVEGAATEKTNPEQAEKYRASNTAQFFDRGIGNDDVRKRTDNFLVVPQPDGSVIEDDGMFDKTIGDLPNMTIGEAYQVPFSFVLDSSAVVDVAQSKIIDTVDHEVFDVREANLDAIAETITANYDGDALAPADFALSLVDDELVIVLSETGKDKLGHDARENPLDGRLELTLSLPTYTVEGKETIEITNNARVEGGTTNDWEWHNDASGSATSYGDELEVKKEVYRIDDGKWTQNLRVPLDEEGNPVETEFIYRVQVLPHGSYAGSFGILDITDVLPDGVKLVGLVSDENVASGTTRSETELDIDGNLHVALDIDGGTIVLSQRDGTKISGDAHINFKVELTAPKADIGIVNKIGTTQAVITPSDGFPLLIQKADSMRDDVVIDDRDARFTIVGPDDEVITEDAFVVDGQLMVENEDGDPTGIVIPEDEKTEENPDGVPAGDYTVIETQAPAGYELADDEVDRTVVATIGGDGSSRAVTLYNDPLSTYAIGDYTWIDANRDGVQGDDEEALPGVIVHLLDGDGRPVTDADGKAVTTTTDNEGFYLFDLLPAGDYTVAFELTAEQAGEYSFTKPLRGDDARRDSDAGAGGLSGLITLGERNGQLVDGADYEHGTVKALHGVDPTWDAGVVQKSYAIGDYTWVDANRDGIQGDDEEILEGVSVELTTADGDEVTDLDGNAVATQETDENGRYLFDNLPAGDYRVTFALTDEQEKRYVFTTANDADANDANADSDALVSEDDEAVAVTERISLRDGNDQLVDGASYLDGGSVVATEGIDPTWDAGVIERSYAIGDVVWIDADRNGLQDDGRKNLLAGVTVNLTDQDGNPVHDVNGDQVEPVVTDEHGNYLFDELPEGEYRVTFTLTDEQKAEYRFTEQDAETDDANADSDADTGTGVTAVIALGPDNAELTEDYSGVMATDGIDPTWDAGVVHRTYAVGDYTWIDANRDGVQGDDEEILEGVRVELLDGEGDPVTDGDGGPLLTTTDEDGRYLFDELPAGDYRLKFTLTDEQEERYSFTRTDAEGDDSRDSDAQRDTGLTAVFTLDGGNVSLVPGSAYELGDVTATEGVDPTWDAGVLESVSVGDYVWFDEDKDGGQDDDEPGIEGVCLELLGPDGEPVVDVYSNDVTPTCTDEDGHYSFDDLPVLDEGESYTVVVTPPDGYEPTTPGTGGRDEDSSTDRASSEGLTVGGQHDLTLDFGFVRIDEPSAGTPDESGDDESGRAQADKPSESGDDLAVTGGQVSLAAGVGALLLLLVGAGLMVASRRRRAARE